MPGPAHPMDVGLVVGRLSTGRYRRLYEQPIEIVGAAESQIYKTITLSLPSRIARYLPTWDQRHIRAEVESGVWYLVPTPSRTMTELQSSRIPFACNDAILISYMQDSLAPAIYSMMSRNLWSDVWWGLCTAGADKQAPGCLTARGAMGERVFAALDPSNTTEAAEFGHRVLSSLDFLPL